MGYQTILDDVDVDTVQSVIDSICLFGALDDTEVRQVLKYLKQTRIKKDATLFEQGSQPDNIYILLSGRVEIECDSPNNDRTQVIANIETGDCFGHISVLGIQPRMGRATVKEDCDLLLLTGDALHAIHRNDPYLFGVLILNLAREVCRRLKASNEALMVKY